MLHVRPCLGYLRVCKHNKTLATELIYSLLRLKSKTLRQVSHSSTQYQRNAFGLEEKKSWLVKKQEERTPLTDLASLGFCSKVVSNFQRTVVWTATTKHISMGPNDWTASRVHSNQHLLVFLRFPNFQTMQGCKGRAAMWPWAPAPWWSWLAQVNAPKPNSVLGPLFQDLWPWVRRMESFCPCGWTIRWVSRELPSPSALLLNAWLVEVKEISKFVERGKEEAENSKYVRNE